MATAKKISLTNAQRREICLLKLHNPDLTQEEILRWAKEEFNLENTPNQTTISRILSNSKEYLSMEERSLTVKRKRKVLQPQLEKSLANWIFRCQIKRVDLTGDKIKDKGRSLAKMLQLDPEKTPNFSNGWLVSFKKRYSVEWQCYRKRNENFSALVPRPLHLEGDLNAPMETEERLCLEDGESRLILEGNSNSRRNEDLSMDANQNGFLSNNGVIYMEL